MKFFLIFSLLIIISSAQLITKTDISRVRNECIKDLDISEELSKQFDHSKYPDDPKTHCFIRCQFSKLNLFDDVNGYNYDLMVKNSQSLDFGNSNDLKKCIENRDNHDVDKCKWAYKTYICILKSQEEESLIFNYFFMKNFLQKMAKFAIL
uniref:Putative odorant binding protein obp n=1 Tax=Corethrella appendiculata TaxID=1370023 RepID=U5ES51_9DIPT